MEIWKVLIDGEVVVSTQIEDRVDIDDVVMELVYAPPKDIKVKYIGTYIKGGINYLDITTQDE